MTVELDRLKEVHSCAGTASHVVRGGPCSYLELFRQLGGAVDKLERVCSLQFRSVVGVILQLAVADVDKDVISLTALESVPPHHRRQRAKALSKHYRSWRCQPVSTPGELRLTGAIPQGL